MRPNRDCRTNTPRQRRTPSTRSSHAGHKRGRRERRGHAERNHRESGLRASSRDNRYHPSLLQPLTLHRRRRTCPEALNEPSSRRTVHLHVARTSSSVRRRRSMQPRGPRRSGMSTDTQASTIFQWWIEDWKECRAVMGRRDGILVDLRKYGFGLITALVGGGALFVSDSDKVNTLSHDLIAGTLAAITLLTFAVFLLDSYYQVLLNSACERCLDLESHLACRGQLSFGTATYLSYDAGKTWVNRIAILLYILLIGIEIYLTTKLANKSAIFITVAGMPVPLFGALALLAMIFYYVIITVRFQWKQKPSWPRLARNERGEPVRPMATHSHASMPRWFGDDVRLAWTAFCMSRENGDTRKRLRVFVDAEKQLQRHPDPSSRR
jgi:hypothetical protein